jgi:hypothetical protein
MLRAAETEQETKQISIRKCSDEKENGISANNKEVPINQTTYKKRQEGRVVIRRR